MNRLIVGLMMVCMIGCGSTAYHIRGPDGNDNWVSISCRRSQSNCVERAGDECPNGYIVHNSSGKDGLYAYGGGGSFNMTTTYNGELLIQCKMGGDK